MYLKLSIKSSLLVEGVTNVTVANKQIIIANFGTDYIEDVVSNDLRYQCPHCKELGKTVHDYKLYVSYKDLVFHCFRCDWKGRLAVEDTYTEAASSKLLKTLAMFAQATTNDQTENDDAADTVYKLPSVIPDPADPAAIYLMSRGVTYDDILYYNMRVPTLDDPSYFLGRVAIPNRLIAGKWTDMYSARAYINLEPKYRNPKNSPRAKTVFNLHNIPQGAEQIIINEGVLTSIVAGRDSVATYGKAVTHDQILQIVNKQPKRIYVSLDNDADPSRGLYQDPTRNKIDELIKKLLDLSGAEIYYVKMPPGKDAVDVGREVYRSTYLKDSVRISNYREYQLLTLTQGANKNDTV